jgi:hypothetical protein
MAYTPELNQKESAILRRIAWAVKKPMTVTLSFIIQMAAIYADRDRVCFACKDRSFCHDCPFQKKGEPNDA